MNYSDDHSSPATPLGGETGDIFAASDVISASPTTSDRVVDTQSGYLVVVKRENSFRAALSVKRRLGTPPGSTIVLTPDEQVKLAKILAEAKSHATAGLSSPRADQYNASLSSKTRGGGADLFLSDAPEKEFARIAASDFSGLSDPAAGRPTIRSGGKRRFPLNRAQLLGLIMVATLVPIIAWNRVQSGHKNTLQQTHEAENVAATMEQVKIDHFVRGFVADMLDFNPATYKSSQIHAMSVMTPQLLERYWNETHFPLSKAQLQAVPKGQTVMITKVNQTPGPEQTCNVDLFAELVSPNGKVSAPVHLQIKTSYGTENQLRVLDQKDMSASK